jgi:hypothetical protein
LVAELKSFFLKRANPLRWLFCAAVVAVFTWNAAFFYLPEQGFTYLIQFGEKMHRIYLPELKAVNHYEMPDSVGYDSQYYAEVALRPNPTDPVLRKSVDGLTYRARRILFPAIAWLAGGGDPARVLNAFALENIVCWFLLAALLMRWLPPVTWGNCLRWAAVLLSFGLTFSVARALLDGPSLLLIASGMALVEAKRPWLAAAVLGVAGLGKDTNVLAAAGMRLPERTDERAWGSWLARCALVLLPLAAWMLCLRIWLGPSDDMGDARNFAAPFAALAEKLQQSVSQLMAEGYPSLAKYDLLVMAGLLAQFLFFALRRRWQDPWWRLGAAYAVLMVFLGGAVWENYPSAAARVLLPMTLAFNVTVPRRRWWPALLLVGNLGVFASADIIKPPGRESFVVKGENSLRINPKDGSVVEAVYGPKNWWRPEKSRWEFWRWSMGDATIAIRNPQPFTLVARLRFRLRSVDERAAIVTLGGRVLWNGMLAPGEAVRARIGEIELPPGDTVLEFRSDRPAAYPGNNDPRRLSFSVRDFEIDVERKK